MTDPEINLRDPRVQEVLDRFNREHPCVKIRVVDIPDGDARAELRDRIAARILRSANSSLNSSDWLYEHDAERFADAVMELFVDVRRSEWLRPGYVIAELAEEPEPGGESYIPRPGVPRERALELAADAAKETMHD